MVVPKPVSQRLLDVRPASNFRPRATAPASNQIQIDGGNVSLPGYGIIPVADTLSPGIPVAAAGFKRYDLIAVDRTGTIVRQAGDNVATAAADLAGAPGNLSSTGPQIQDGIYPIAWVLVDETAAVVVDEADIFPAQGLTVAGRALQGYRVSRGSIGSVPAASSVDVSALFAADTPGGSSTSVGVVTSPPSNMVQLLDQKKDELTVAAGANVGNRIFGRLTEAAGVWTLSFFTFDNTGAEVAIADLAAEANGPPTDVELNRVSIVLSANDPARPLFDSGFDLISDQVAATIPDATTVAAGKVTLATNLDTVAGKVVQSNDSRLPTQDLKDAMTAAAPAATGANPFITASDPNWVQLANLVIIARAPINFRYYGLTTANVGPSRDTMIWTIAPESDNASYSANLNPLPPVQIDGVTGLITLDRPPVGIDYLYTIKFSQNKSGGNSNSRVALHSVTGGVASANPLIANQDPSINTVNDEKAKGMVEATVFVDNATVASKPNQYEIQVDAAGFGATSNILTEVSRLEITRVARLSNS